MIVQKIQKMLDPSKCLSKEGNFKVRSTGIFWWSEHGRGNKNKGIIDKQYQAKQL